MKILNVPAFGAKRTFAALALACCLFAASSADARADVEALEPAPSAATQVTTVDTSAADPIVRVAGHRRCSSRTVVITPSYTNGTLVKSVLFVNGRLMLVATDPAARFHLGVRRFKAGRNNYEIVSVFSSGKSASTIGSFSRCSRRG